jgi:hypothetical protein
MTAMRTAGRHRIGRLPTATADYFTVRIPFIPSA